MVVPTTEPEGEQAGTWLRDAQWKRAYGPNDRPLETFYVPALSRAQRYDRIAGFFSSAALAAAAAGVAALVARGGKMRLLVGARLSGQDVDAILKGATLQGRLAGDWVEGTGNGSAALDGTSCYAYREYDSGGSYEYWGTSTGPEPGPRNDIDLIRPIPGTTDQMYRNAIPGAGQWLEIDVTPTVQAWQEGSLLNNGFFLETSSANPTGGVDFHSSEYAADASLRPMLVVEYAMPEPGTLLLVLAGGLLPLCRRRRVAG